MSPIRTAAFVVAIICLHLGTANAGLAPVQVIDLGSLSPGVNGDALAIDRKGEVVGFSGQPAFVWTRESGMTALPLPQGANFTAAEAISSHGDIALFSSHFGTPSSFILSGDALIPLPGSMKIVGVNARLHAVALGFDEAVFGAFWDGSTFTRVGTEARGLNDHDQVVGYRIVTEPQFANLAFVWKDGEYRDLGTLGGRDSIANAISANGVVVGRSQATFSGPELGFRWERGAMEALACPAGATSCEATAVDEDGEIVVGVAHFPGSFIFETVPRAVVWIGGVVRDLNALIDPASGWVLETANGVNKEGQIVGRGQREGQFRPYLLTLEDD